jgi:glutamate-1-semialdehyde 2,1-aminomutase
MTFNERASRVIPGGAHTYSKGRDQFPANAPQALVRGKGARVWDLDGREFVDWGMGINNVLIGHAEDSVDEAACTALRGGQNFSRPTLREVEAAEQLSALVDGAEMVKFAKNGSDANTAALRLARAITGRKRVLFDGAAPFLAIHDWFIGHTPVDAGVPDAERQLAHPFTFNDLASAKRLFAEHRSDVAAVILEPCRERRPAPGFLEGLRALCDQHGAVLIFDEIVTGFRYYLHGASRLFGVRPDLITLGKGMANGYAVAALAGGASLMARGGLDHTAERVFLLSTTNGAEQSGLAAQIATIDFYQRHDVIGQLSSTGRAAAAAIRNAAQSAGVSEFLKADGDFDCRPVIVCLDHDGLPSAQHRTLFHQELLKRGVFMPWICPSFRHGASELDQTAEACAAAARVYAQAIERRSVETLLEGSAVRPVMRRYNNS